MDDLIPLLIVILISIVGAVSNNKKKKRMESGNIAESKLSNRDEDLLDWLDRLDINKEEQKESFEEPIPEMQPIKVENVKTAPSSITRTPMPANVNIFDKYSGFITSNERKDLMEKEGIPTIVKNHVTEGDLTKQLTQESKKEEKKSKIELDMKKAIIYNEILKRKYS